MMEVQRATCVWCEGSGFIFFTDVLCRTCGGTGTRSVKMREQMGDYESTFGLYHVWSPETAEPCDADVLEAEDPEHAVLIWIHDYDGDNDYSLLNGGERLHVRVKKFGEEKVHDFSVTGEMVPEYHVELLENDPTAHLDGETLASLDEEEVE